MLFSYEELLLAETQDKAELCELFCVTDEDELSSVSLSVSDNHVDQTALVQFDGLVSFGST